MVAFALINAGGGVLVQGADEVSRPSRAIERPAGPRSGNVPRFTPEERQKRRLQIKERLKRQVSELQKRKAAGTITEEEGKRLQRLQLLASRFERRGAENPPSGVFGTSSNESVNNKKAKSN
jgi:hypothetical protein